LRDLEPGEALDLACGGGRHARWLADCGWRVTAVDQDPEAVPGVLTLRADLEDRDFGIAPGHWDLIVCWMYWQETLLPDIAAGVRQGGVVALAGKTTGRFATSLAEYRRAFPGWSELWAGEDAAKAYFVGRRPQA
jgi:SAM-dependent methyltransferase